MKHGWESGEMHTKLLSKKLDYSNNLQRIGVDGRIIFK
jgi:hypothetical protein